MFNLKRIDAKFGLSKIIKTLHWRQFRDDDCMYTAFFIRVTDELEKKEFTLRLRTNDNEFVIYWCITSEHFERRGGPQTSYIEPDVARGPQVGHHILRVGCRRRACVHLMSDTLLIPQLGTFALHLRTNDT